MSLDRMSCIVVGGPGAAAILCYAQADAPLVCLSAAIHDSRVNAEASTEWANVAQARDQADELAFLLVKSGSDHAEGCWQFARWTTADDWRKSVVDNTGSKIEARGGFSRQLAAAA
jgi:hypothetical protein